MRQRWGFSERDEVVFAAGRLVEKKGFAYLIDAVGALASESNPAPTRATADYVPDVAALAAPSSSELRELIERFVVDRGELTPSALLPTGGQRASAPGMLRFRALVRGQRTATIGCALGNRAPTECRHVQNRTNADDRRPGRAFGLVVR